MAEHEQFLTDLDEYLNGSNRGAALAWALIALLMAGSAFLGFLVGAA